MTWRTSMAAAAVISCIVGIAGPVDAKEPAAAVRPSPKAAAAPPAATPPLTVTRRVVEGRVMHAGKRSISVELEATADASTEMLLPLAGNVEIRGVKSVAELKYGDHVKVGIEQSFRTGDDGKPVLVKTEALVIVLLKAAEGAAATP